MDFVETVSDNEVESESDDDIVGEAVYDEEYLKKRKQRKHSSGSEGDEEYRWDEDNAEYEEEEEEEEEEDSPSASEEDSDEKPRKLKKLSQRETKLNNLRPGVRRSKRATRVDYQQYELSDSDREATRSAKRKRLVDPEEPSDETGNGIGNGNFSMASQESEENANEPETKAAEEELTEVNTNGKENEQVNKANGREEEEEVEGVSKRRYLDLNELAPVSGFDDGLSTVVSKDDDGTTDDS